MSATARAHTFGRSLTASDKTRMATNVSPSISPDGKHIVFFSSRDLFSIDLYLAEAATGRIVRKLVDTAQNSHFTSLQFISSAGSWSPNSRQFVVGGVHAGKAVLAILNIADADVAREIEVPQVGEILNPTWSPNGKAIAFSATVGGDSDLFIYDLTVPQDVTAGERHQANYERLLRGSSAGMVARRRHDRVCHRPLHHERCPAQPRRLSAGVVRRGVGTHLAALDIRPGEEHQPAVGARQPESLLCVRSERHQQRVPRQSAVRRDGAGHQHRQRHQRHHRAEPGDFVGDRRTNSGGQRVRRQQPSHLRDRFATAARRSADRAGSRAPAGGVAAAGSARVTRRADAERSVDWSRRRLRPRSSHTRPGCRSTR